MKRHVLQSDLWEKFKNSYGTPAIRVGNIVYTKHKIPFTNFSYGYCPRVNPFDIDFGKVEESLKENDCVAIHFDVPNVIKDDPNADKAIKLLKDNCAVSSRSEFAKANLLIDLTKSEEELFENMHRKHRYNIKYAQKKGVTVRESTSDEDFDIFYNIYWETGRRQKFFSRSRVYMEKVWKTFREKDASFLLIAEYNGKPLSAWMILIYDGVAYYPYGGSIDEERNVHPSCLLGWEAIRFGKKMNCTLFDMWGASEDMTNKSDSYLGFSIFKQKFGAKHVVYIPSYDYVINESVYRLFTVANNVRWKIFKYS